MTKRSVEPGDDGADPPTLASGPGSVWRRVLLVYLALCLAGVIGVLTARIAPLSPLNPKLFTGHHSTETYRALDDPFKPRLFSYLAARMVLAPVPESTVRTLEERRFYYDGGVLTDRSFGRSVGLWSFGWMLGILGLAALGPRPFLFMLGSTLGVAYAYSVQSMVHPYDLPALFFATAAVVAVQRGKSTWLAAILPIGMGFKETLGVFVALAWAGPEPWRERLRRIALLGTFCLIVLSAIDFYSGRSLGAFESISVEESTGEGTAKLLLNFASLWEKGPQFLLANAGFAWLVFLLPGKDRKDRALKLTAALFLLGIFCLAGATEWRIWFELLPLNLALLGSFLDRMESSRPLRH